MASNIDLTQLMAGCLLQWLNLMPEDADEQKHLKADISLSSQIFLEVAFFLIWYFLDDGEGKYYEYSFFIASLAWLIFFVTLFFSQFNYITGIKNDVHFRESWGKITDIIQNTILLIYFTFEVKKDSSYQNISFITVVSYNCLLSLIELVILLYLKQFRCCKALAQEQDPPEGGFILFMVSNLIGLGFSFAGIYFAYIREMNANRTSQRNLLFFGMCGDGILVILNLKLLFRFSKKQYKQMTNHKKVLMIISGIACGMCCVFVSVVTCLMAFIAFFDWCCSKPQVTPVSNQVEDI